MKERIQEMSHDEQVARLFHLLAEIKSIEPIQGTRNRLLIQDRRRVTEIVEEVAKLSKATTHYPEVKTEIFKIAKNLLLNY
ncbi:hypothetical protein DRN73_05290 [Candidatus Pacearchaeota archaeon]|nr:MAG: hypothetical protein DRN73_05290 [Candidatus Pacearchaeota archaeon]